MAGHAGQILERITPGGRLLGIDRDPEAVEAGRRALAGFGSAATVVQGRFSDLGQLAASAGFPSVDMVLFDFGISSAQLDTPERGFSFRSDGPLDMRMDPGGDVTAAQIVNQYEEAEIERILRTYGEERWARRVAKFIVARRPLRTTGDLTQAVEAAIPRKAWPRDIHVATRTFQGLRIAVNDELGELERGLPSLIRLLRPGGRVGVVSFHSLEDIRVKRLLSRLSTACTCPPSQPVCTCAHRATLSLLNRRAVMPGAAECLRNPRARSARLRAAVRLPDRDPVPA